MSDESRVAHPLSDLLEQWGTGAGHPVWEAIRPAVERGTGAVLAAPPAPAWAAPAMAAAAERALAGDGLALTLMPEALLDASAEVAGPMSAAIGRPIVVAPAPGRAARLLKAPGLAGLVTTRANALELLARSALPAERVRAVVIAWPELEPAGDLADLMQAIPRESPRVIVTADPAGQAELIERYAWRAPVLGPLGTPPVVPPAARELRVAEVAWSGRLAALAAIVDVADPEGLTVWTADASRHDAIRVAVAATGIEPRLTSEPEPAGGTLVAFDPPPPETLAALEPGTAVLLMPPGTERYLNAWVERLIPLSLPGPADAVRAANARERRAIEARVARGDLRGSFAALEPLFERTPAQTIAAALHALWTEPPSAPAAAPRPATAPADTAVRVWASAGRKDGVTLGAWLAFLTQDLGLPRESVGRLDVRETFTIIECPGRREAESLVRELAGRTLKERRLTARIDRGPEAARERRGPRRRSP